jgi:hypothetical protein
MLTHEQLHAVYNAYAEKDSEKYGHPILDFTEWLKGMVPIPCPVSDLEKRPKKNTLVFLCYKGEWYKAFYTVSNQSFVVDAKELETEDGLSLKIEGECYWIPRPYTDFTWYSDEEAPNPNL